MRHHLTKLAADGHAIEAAAARSHFMECPQDGNAVGERSLREYGASLLVGAAGALLTPGGTGGKRVRVAVYTTLIVLVAAVLVAVSRTT